MYGKIFKSTFNGSLYGKGAVIQAVWAHVIANAEPPGYVELNPEPLANSIGDVTATQVEQAIEFLCQPDPKSRNPADEGRRLVREGQYLYRVVTWHEYQAIQNKENRREYQRTLMANRRAAKRAAKAVSTATNGVSKREQPLAELAHIDVDVDVNANKEKTKTSARAIGKTLSRPEKTNPQFDHLWDAYPKHTYRERAIAAFGDLNPDDGLFHRIIESVEEHKASDQWTDTYQARHIPTLEKFLTEKLWTDEL